ncbi:MAG TPA: hypothetical protein VFL17_15305 [Anaerolineae bacterium]|nr:hypothetical protein [Anaerolineae bacterium]
MKQTLVRHMILVLAITAPTWFGVASGIALDTVIPLQSVVVLIVAAGDLIGPDVQVAEEVPASTQEDAPRRRSTRRDK